MAEALLRELGGDRFQAASAGIKPGRLNPLAVEAMNEIGIDISGQKVDSAFEFYKEGRLFDYVITVCDEDTEKHCPVFPGITARLHWEFPDPAEFEGTHEEKLAEFRKVRDSIKEKIEAWLGETR